MQEFAPVPRAERPFAAGDRVSIDAPGHSFHAVTGTVAADAVADGCLFVLRDDFPVGHRKCEVFCGTAEVEMLEDQRPNFDHYAPDRCRDRTFWWRDVAYTRFKQELAQ